MAKSCQVTMAFKTKSMGRMTWKTTIFNGKIMENPLFLMGKSPFLMGKSTIWRYPLVVTNIANWKTTMLLMGKSTIIKWPFSIAMLNYQRVPTHFRKPMETVGFMVRYGQMWSRSWINHAEHHFRFAHGGVRCDFASRWMTMSHIFQRASSRTQSYILDHTCVFGQESMCISSLDCSHVLTRRYVGWA